MLALCLSAALALSLSLIVLVALPPAPPSPPSVLPAAEPARTFCSRVSVPSCVVPLTALLTFRLRPATAPPGVATKEPPASLPA